MDLEVLKHYKLDIPSIDNEHTALFTVLNEILNTDGTEQKTFILLRDYEQMTLNHFANEEKFMKEINYPYIDRHAYVHKKFLNSFDSAMYEISRYTPPCADKYLIRTLGRNFLAHIDTYDMEISDYLRKKRSYG